MRRTAISAKTTGKKLGTCLNVNTRAIGNMVKLYDTLTNHHLDRQPSPSHTLTLFKREGVADLWDTAERSVFVYGTSSTSI